MGQFAETRTDHASNDIASTGSRHCVVPSMLDKEGVSHSDENDEDEENQDDQENVLNQFVESIFLDGGGHLHKRL